MKTMNRIVLLLLCVFTLVASCFLGNVRAADDLWTTIQAEDDENYTIINHYGRTQNDVGAAEEESKSKWPTYDWLTKNTHFDKTNTPYVALTVRADNAGNYSFRVRYKYGSGNSGDHFVTVVANEGGAGKVGKAMMHTKGSFAETDTATVRLEKGLNVVYFILMTKDQLTSNDAGWADLDYIKIDGRLDAVPKSVITSAPYDGVTHLFSGKNNGTGYVVSADTLAVAEKKVSAQSISLDKLAYVPFASYTVVAPEDGYYHMTCEFAATTDKTTLAYLVDGKKADTSVNFHYDVYENGKQVSFWTTQGYHKADISAYLTKGEHIITITSMLPKTDDAAKTAKYSWTDLGKVELYGGLTMSKEQKNPLAIGMTTLEAEDWALRNWYEKTEDAWRFSGGTVVSNGGGTRQTTADLMLHLDKKEQSYLEYLVTAPKAGKYELKLGLVFGALADFPDDFRPYALLWVNGKTVKLDNPFDRGSVTCIPVTVELGKGVNVIRVIGVTQDQNVIGKYTLDGKEADNKLWINHDYLLVDEELTAVVNNGTLKVEAESAAYVGQFLVGDNKYFSGGKCLGQSTPSAAQAGVTSKNLNLDNFEAAPWLSYTIVAPADGYYTVNARVDMEGQKPQMGKVGLLVDGKAYSLNMWRNKWGDPNDAETVVYLTKGQHTVIATGLLGDSFAKVTDVTWFDYDYLEFGSGITLADVQRKPTTATPFTRYEAEEYGICNYYFRGTKDNDSSGGLANALKNSPSVQSWEELKKNGLSAKDTPFVQFTVNAASAGTYTLRIGMSYLHQGTIATNYSSFAIIVNGVAQEVRLPLYHNKYCKYFPLTLTLDLAEGINSILFTSILKDTAAEDSYVNSHYDYLDLPQGLSAVAVERLEAESSDYNGYAIYPRTGRSGESCLGEEDWEGVWSNDMSFANLTYKNRLAVPFVQYTITAPEDGTYRISVGYDAGGSGSEMQCFMAYSVNGSSFEKLYFNRKMFSAVSLDVHLKKGDNTLIFTGALKDFMNFPKFPSQVGGYNLWIDHDYLDLGFGLTAVQKNQLPANTGDAEADVDVNLDDIWGPLTGPQSGGQIQDDTNPTDHSVWIWVGCGAGIAVVAAVVVILAILRKKKKQ